MAPLKIINKFIKFIVVLICFILQYFHFLNFQLFKFLFFCSIRVFIFNEIFYVCSNFLYSSSSSTSSAFKSFSLNISSAKNCQLYLDIFNFFSNYVSLIKHFFSLIEQTLMRKHKITLPYSKVF